MSSVVVKFVSKQTKKKLLKGQTTKLHPAGAVSPGPLHLIQTPERTHLSKLSVRRPHTLYYIRLFIKKRNDNHTVDVVWSYISLVSKTTTAFALSLTKFNFRLGQTQITPSVGGSEVNMSCVQVGRRCRPSLSFWNETELLFALEMKEEEPDLGNSSCLKMEHTFPFCLVSKSHLQNSQVS